LTVELHVDLGVIGQASMHYSSRSKCLIQQKLHQIIEVLGSDFSLPDEYV